MPSISVPSPAMLRFTPPYMPPEALPLPEGYARFDSPRGGGRSFEFRELREVVSCERLDEVLPALARVERAVEGGRHGAGFISYEAAAGFDPAMRAHPPVPGLPLLWFGIFASRGPPPPLGGEEGPPGFTLGPWETEIGPQDYSARVADIREWIAAGDTYQVNYTFRLRASFDGSDEALYRRLCLSQRSGYCALLRLPRFTIVSASPELFFLWADDRLEMRPMKGTRPRGRWAEEDDLRAEELLHSEKERAENLMIVDLVRNDAGRVAKYGSVQVDPLFEVESFPTVHQLTSTVRATTRTGATLSRVVQALFPSGSVTGAPKLRTMEIIDALEDSPRGVYTGAIGFLSPGEAVFNVPIRTLLIDRATARVEMGVGSGVTYDSNADAEYAECLQKAAFTRHPVRAFDLLETMLYRPGEGILLLDEHLARITASARYFAFPLDPRKVREALRDGLSGASAPLKVRLLVDAEGRVGVERYPLGPEGAIVRACVAREPIDDSEVFLYHKTTWREIYRSRLDDHPGYDDVLLRNERDELTEFTTGNLVLRMQGEAWTPPVESGLLPGTFRAALLRAGEIRERVLRRSDLAEADGIYRVNSVHSWSKVEMAP